METKICEFCKKEFRYDNGHFVTHIYYAHECNLEKYIVLFEFNGIHPKCQCGFCNDDALFMSRKRKFHDINPEHRGFDWLEQKYIEKFGKPLCKTCNEPVKFHRGEPNIYCSHKCLPSHWNQEQVHKTVKEKWDVDNVFELQFV